jgi:hypothetical protein
MKYSLNQYKSHNVICSNITTTSDETTFTSFPAVVGNPNYDAFLTQAELTDKQVHALKPDVWYDFPNGDK